MDEKILIKSERCNLKRLFIVIIIIGIIAGFVYASTYLFENFSDDMNRYTEYKIIYQAHTAAGSCGEDADKKCFCCRRFPTDYKSKANSAFGYAWSKMSISDFDLGISFAIFGGVAVIGAVIYLSLKKNELTVTDKRVYGIRAWGKRVDLPVDSVSATAKLKWGVAVATSSGTVRFRFLKNSKDIYDVLNNLVIERQKQENKVPTTSTTIIQSSDSADQLKKFKDLLDAGVITQEEFDAKKKQLLGL